MTEADVEKIIKSNMILQMNLAGIRAEFEEKLQRKPLTDEDLRKLADKHLFYQPEGYEVSGVFALARAIEAAHGIKGEA